MLGPIPVPELYLVHRGVAAPSTGRNNAQSLHKGHCDIAAAAKFPVLCTARMAINVSFSMSLCKNRCWKTC